MDLARHGWPHAAIRRHRSQRTRCHRQNRGMFSRQRRPSAGDVAARHRGSGRTTIGLDWGGATMSRLWHLLATDLRRHRWLLLLWSVVTLASAAAPALLPLAATDPRAASEAGFAYFLLSCTYVTLF